MYADQFMPWQPSEMLIETVNNDLTIASLLYPDEFVCIDVAEWLSIRAEVNWIIAEMMGFAPGRLSNGPDNSEVS